MSEQRRGTGGPGALSGTIWFMGWLFTVGFTHPAFWKALLAIIIWPYYLGAALVR